jgi:DNA-binding CsgD family transcriptional regulator
MIEKLSRREYDAVLLASTGMSRKKIAKTMGITCGTLNSYLASAYTKLDVNRRAQLPAIFMNENANNLHFLD